MVSSLAILVLEMFLDKYEAEIYPQRYRYFLGVFMMIPILIACPIYIFSAHLYRKERLSMKGLANSIKSSG
jgi:hypothetical protein